MWLHATNIAYSAGIPVIHIKQAVDYMLQRNDIS